MRDSPAAGSSSLLRGQGLVVTLGSTRALAGASIAVRTGELVAVVGPSGSGKSTLLHCLSGILRPVSGTVELNGRRIDTLSDEERSELRRTAFGFVFQFGDLVPELSLVENVSLPLRFAGLNRSVSEERARRLLDEVDVGGLASRRPGEVSGGEMQRAAIARALVHEPAVVFADEPTGALDSDNGEMVLRLLAEQARRRGCSVVMATHEASAAQIATRVVSMRDGRVVDG